MQRMGVQATVLRRGVLSARGVRAAVRRPQTLGGEPAAPVRAGSHAPTDWRRRGVRALTDWLRPASGTAHGALPVPARRVSLPVLPSGLTEVRSPDIMGTLRQLGPQVRLASTAASARAPWPTVTVALGTDTTAIPRDLVRRPPPFDEGVREQTLEAVVGAVVHPDGMVWGRSRCLPTREWVATGADGSTRRHVVENLPEALYGASASVDPFRDLSLSCAHYACLGMLRDPRTQLWVVLAARLGRPDVARMQRTQTASLFAQRAQRLGDGRELRAGDVAIYRPEPASASGPTPIGHVSVVIDVLNTYEHGRRIFRAAELEPGESEPRSIDSRHPDYVYPTHFLPAERFYTLVMELGWYAFVNTLRHETAMQRGERFRPAGFGEPWPRQVPGLVTMPLRRGGM